MSGRWIDSLDLGVVEQVEAKNRLPLALMRLAQYLYVVGEKQAPLDSGVVRQASALIVVERRRLAAGLTPQQRAAWDYRLDDIGSPTLLAAIDSLVAAMMRGGDANAVRVTNLRTAEAVLRSLWKAGR